MENVQLSRIGLNVLTACLLFVCLPVKASERLKFEDRVYRENIRTVQMHVKGWEMSYPVIEFGSGEELIISFDDLDGDIKNYRYTIIHCNADWTESGLFPSDFMDGFYENPIDDYHYSFNTFVPYTHYSLVLPNYDVSLKLPGNYIIKVFEDQDENKAVITRKFMISEPKVQIEARVHRPQMTMYYRTGQQVSINIYHPRLNISNPHSELYVTIIQNGRKDNAVQNPDPMYIRDGEIVYEHEEEMVFPAGNEFRNFDTKSLRYQTEFIRNIDFSDGINHVELHPSSPRLYDSYFSHHDLNGRYLIRNEEGHNPSVDADYVMVRFTMPLDIPFDNGDVYVTGALSGWNFYDWNRMRYNFDSEAYELDMLLKQGYYNYQYVFMEDGASVADATLFEGNFFETENDYFIMVYHRQPGSRIDRLVGTKRVNSRD